MVDVTDAKLHVDGKVVEVGADLLLDLVTTGVGTQENVGLHDLALLASVRGLQHELGELGARWTKMISNDVCKCNCDSSPWAMERVAEPAPSEDG